MSAVKQRFVDNGQRIRRARKSLGVSQEKFAPLVGTTRRNLIRLENGENLPRPALRDRIVAETGTTEQIKANGDDEDEAAMSLDDFLRPHIQRILREELA